MNIQEIRYTEFTSPPEIWPTTGHEPYNNENYHSSENIIKMRSHHPHPESHDSPKHTYYYKCHDPHLESSMSPPQQPQPPTNTHLSYHHSHPHYHHPHPHQPQYDYDNFSSPPHSIPHYPTASQTEFAENIFNSSYCKDNDDEKEKLAQESCGPSHFNSLYQKNTASPSSMNSSPPPPPPTITSSQSQIQSASGQSDGFTVPPCNNNKTRKTSLKRRATSNKKERRRSQSINNAFAELRDCIPNVPADTKLSKIKTLRLAMSYITHISEVLSGDDPLLTPQAFTAEVSKRMGRGRSSGEKKRKELLMHELSEAGIKHEERKRKGRTGWPQHVWSLELQQ